MASIQNVQAGYDSDKLVHNYLAVGSAHIACRAALTRTLEEFYSLNWFNLKQMDSRDYLNHKYVTQGVIYWKGKRKFSYVIFRPFERKELWEEREEEGDWWRQFDYFQIPQLDSDLYNKGMLSCKGH